MFRTALTSISLYGVTLLKSVNASTDDLKKETIVIQNDKRHSIGGFFDELEKLSVTSQFMAEPLTDQEKLEENKDDMKTKMELMIMRIQKKFCEALEKEEDPQYRFRVQDLMNHEHHRLPNILSNKYMTFAPFKFDVGYVLYFKVSYFRAFYFAYLWHVY